MARSVLEGLTTLLPRERVLSHPEHLSAYQSDGLTAFSARPVAVAVPETSDEVIALVKFCHEQRLPFVARGSGTSLSGGSLPVANGIVIALNRLNRILRLDPEQRFAVVEPGVVNNDVTAAAAPWGLHYAPDPSSQPVCTIGGNVAFNAGGAHCLKYGMTSNHVLGIKAVLATGEVVEWGGPSRESVGPDWCGLFTGSEGLFGIALEITLQLLHRAECYHTVLAGFRTLEEAGDAVSAVVASGLLPGAIEIMESLALDAARAAVHAEYPPGCDAVLIVELEGPRETVAADRARLDAILDASRPVEVRLARDQDERQTIWKGRKSAFSAVGRLSPDFLVQDGVVPRRRLGEALRRISEMSREAGIRCANVFHAGDGNLHPLILFDGREPGALEKSEALAGRILKMCVEMGGSITGEHGVGVEKRGFLPVMFSGEEIDCMKRLRAAFDPLTIANPGKMFPEDGEAASSSSSSSSSSSELLDDIRGRGGERERGRDSAEVTPSTVPELVEAIKSASHVRVVGAGTKPRLSVVTAGQEQISANGFTTIRTTALRGILEYDPSEFTFTALAGTPLVEIAAALAERGQYMPFDPMLIEAGATLGGTVAAGMSGPGRFRYGGLRDFILGVRFVDGAGRLLRMGGKVVKNAAGFDLPKFFVGSLGRFGILAEITFKVFPAPASMLILRLPTDGVENAVQTMNAAANSRWELSAIDMPPGACEIWLRLDGPATAVEALAREVLARWPGQVTSSAEGEKLWSDLREMRWAHGNGPLMKIALTPAAVPSLAETIESLESARAHFSAGGNVAYISLPSAHLAETLHERLSEFGLCGVTLRGDAPLFLGSRRHSAISKAVKNALDPANRFPSLG